MNFIRKSYLAAFSLLAIAGVFAGCNEEENVAKAVMTSANSLSFPGEEAAEQIITVYSDAEWTADVPEWITIDPSTGSGTTDVVVSVSANMRDGSLDNPRSAELVFHGKTLMSRASVLVKQSGDKFRDVASSTVSEVAAADDKSVVIINEAQVVALSTKGFIISDGSANVLVSVAKDVTPGETVAIYGTKSSDKGLPVISECDKLEVKSEGTVTYPEAKDITETLSAYVSENIEFVSVKGILKGNAVAVENSDMSVYVQDPVSSLNIADLNRHYVTVSGYFVGTAKPYHNVVVTAVEDRGKYFEMNEGFPIEWTVGKVEDETIKTFTNTGSFSSTTGSGTISYIQDPSNKELASAKFAYVIGGTGEPYVNGSWPGDCWEFKSDSPISSGTTIGVEFSARVSGGGFKYWRLEYLDGTEWKVLGATKTTTYDGKEVAYTHEMNKDGSTNVQVREQFTVTSNTENACVRFYIVSNVTAKGATQAAPSGNTARLSNRYDDNDVNPKLTIISGGSGDQPGGETGTVVFEDDFSWLEPIITAYNNVAEKKIGDTVADLNNAEAPNAYNDALKDAFFKLFNGKGYEDMCPAEETLYIQDQYLKFSRTKGHNTALRLPKLSLDSASDITVEFDFAAMVQGDGTIDDTKLVVRVDGDGEFDNGTKYSDVIGQTQGKGEIFWTHAKTTVKGATSNTRLVIVMYRVLTKNDAGAYTGEYNYNVSGAGRFFLDNIKITK